MNEIKLDQETQGLISGFIDTAPESISRRAKLIDAYAKGMQTYQAAQVAGLSRSRARYWKREFLQKGLTIFASGWNSSGGNDSFEDIIAAFNPVESNPHHEIDDFQHDPQDGEAKKKKHGVRQGKRSEILLLPFPEPVKTPGVLPNDSLAEAGRKVFRAQFAEMLSHESGTRSGDDIESLHDMRVASRRMRAAFEVFRPAYNSKVIKKHLTGLRQVGKLLGSVRDLDVFMEKAETYISPLPLEDRIELNPLLEAWQSQLSPARSRLINYFDSDNYDEFKLLFNYFVQTEGEGVIKNQIDEPRPHRLCEVVPTLIYSRLASVRAYGPFVTNATITQLHALRIEFKKLRYALEFFIEVLGEEAKQVIGLIKKLQDHLGDMHDADVACHILNAFLNNWDVSQSGLLLTERQNPTAIVNYLAYQHAERHRLLVTFPEAWTLFERPETMRHIAAAVSVL